MSGYTKGPWEKLTFSNHELQTDFAMIKIGIRVHMIGHSSEDFANARLIAAAPDLLEALERLVSAARDVDHGYMDQSIASAEAAIARARGEA